MPPPRPANGDTIYIIHTHLDPLLIRCPCWPASTANQSGPVTLTFDLESGVRVTCDVGYHCANFSFPRPLCSRLRPDVRDRQTDVRRASSLNAPCAGHNNRISIAPYDHNLRGAGGRSDQCSVKT